MRDVGWEWLRGMRGCVATIWEGGVATVWEGLSAPTVWDGVSAPTVGEWLSADGMGSGYGVGRFTFLGHEGWVFVKGF